MECARYREWIQELTDGTIGPIQKAELERHLDECAGCRALTDDLHVIQETAASLDALQPPDGVWLQIAGRLRQEGRLMPPPPRAETPRRNFAVLALAATLVLAVGASMFVLIPQFRANRAGSGGVAVESARQPAGNSAAEDTVQTVESEFRLAEQHYQNAIAKLEQAAKLDQAASNDEAIDPQTAATLQKSLRVIDQAIAESRAALRSEPQSAPARDSLFDALKRKVVLLQDTIALMNEMRKGNSAGAAQIGSGLNKS